MTLAARGLAFGYAPREVGRGVDLAMAPGEVVCLLGPNGCGKTTLLRTLLGLLAPLGGEVLLEGRPLSAWSDAERARRVAYVPQAAESYFDFSVRELVEMGRTAHRGVFARPGPADRAAAAGALAALGIESLAERPIHRVSGGERQLVLIARALAAGARLVVMDEPTANLDFGNQQRVLAEVARLKAAGIAVLVCSHDPDHAFRVADRALLLARGSPLALGPVSEVLTAERLSALYGVAIAVAEVHTADGMRRVCVPAMAA